MSSGTGSREGFGPNIKEELSTNWSRLTTEWIFTRGGGLPLPWSIKVKSQWALVGGFAERTYKADKVLSWMTFSEWYLRYHNPLTYHNITIISFIESYQNLQSSSFLPVDFFFLPLPPDCELMKAGPLSLSSLQHQAHSKHRGRIWQVTKWVNEWFLRLLSILSQWGIRLRLPLVHPLRCFFKKDKIFFGSIWARKRKKRKRRSKTI